MRCGSCKFENWEIAILISSLSPHTFKVSNSNETQEVINLFLKQRYYLLKNEETRQPTTSKALEAEAYESSTPAHISTGQNQEEEMQKFVFEDLCLLN